MHNRPETVYVSFSAQIAPQTTEVLIGQLSQFVNEGIPKVHLLISTPGGSVMDGLNIYNVLKGMPIELTTHNVGNVDSIGNAIFQAGDRRFACPRSTFMFHGVGFDIDGRHRLEEKTLRERLDSLNADQRRVGAIIEEHSNLSGPEIERLFLEQTTKDAAAALDAGLIDEICDVSIPENGPMVSLVFNR